MEKSTLGYLSDIIGPGETLLFSPDDGVASRTCAGGKSQMNVRGFRKGTFEPPANDLQQYVDRVSLNLKIHNEERHIESGDRAWKRCEIWCNKGQRRRE